MYTFLCQSKPRIAFLATAYFNINWIVCFSDALTYAIDSILLPFLRRWRAPMSTLTVQLVASTRSDFGMV